MTHMNYEYPDKTALGRFQRSLTHLIEAVDNYLSKRSKEAKTVVEKLLADAWALSYACRARYDDLRKDEKGPDETLDALDESLGNFVGYLKTLEKRYKEIDELIDQHRIFSTFYRKTLFDAQKIGTEIEQKALKE